MFVSVSAQLVLLRAKSRPPGRGHRDRHRATFGLELASTGPNTGVIPVRHEEQVLLELITGAGSSLMFVSYAVNKIARKREALVAVVRSTQDGSVS